MLNIMLKPRCRLRGVAPKKYIKDGARPLRAIQRAPRSWSRFVQLVSLGMESALIPEINLAFILEYRRHFKMK